MECSKEGPLPDKLRAVNVWSQNVTDGLFSHVLRDKSDFGEWGGSIIKKKNKTNFVFFFFEEAMSSNL